MNTIQPCRGMAATQTLTILAVASVLGLAAFGLIREQTHVRQCIKHLEQIYQALELYEIDHGRLPYLALYPDDPKHGPDSLLVVLDPYGMGGETGICPAAPPFTREQGLGYIWNVRLNGRSMYDGEEPQWMLIEINALTERVRPPHWRGYHVLYTDGVIRHHREPPEGVREVRP